MTYFLMFLACAGAWVAFVYFLPRLIEDIKKAFADKAAYIERLTNPPPCRDCLWCEPFDNNLYKENDLDRCTYPGNPYKYSETFRDSDCGITGRYFKEK